MKHFNQSRWNHLCAAAGVTPSLAFDDLLAHYSEPHRAYHNARHIDECLAELDSARSDSRNPDAVEFAIWFHDAIYDPRAGDNEEQSARLARESLATFGARSAEHVSDLILTTKTHIAGEIP